MERVQEPQPERAPDLIDIQPNATTQAQEREDVLNVGGFSDAVFTLVADFAAGRLQGNHWVGVIEKVALEVSAA